MLLGLAGCCEAARQEASTFVNEPQNRRCRVDSDCVVVSTMCAELDGSSCHQVGLSREAAESQAWALLEDELRLCAPLKCNTCLAALIPSCNEGLCN